MIFKNADAGAPMTPKNFPAQNADAPDAGEGAAAENTASPMDELAASVAEFESGQKDALEVLLGHAARLQDEFALLASRPTPEQLAEAEQTAADRAETIAARDGELGEARTIIAGLESELATAGTSAAEAARDLEAANTRSAAMSGELATAQEVIAARDLELSALRDASAKDATALQSFRDRFRSFEAATQSIMAGIALSDGVPDAAAVPASAPAPAIAAPADEADVVVAETPHEEAGAPAVETPADEAAAPAAKSAANVVPDPFDLDDAPAPAPVGITLPDLDDLDEDPFDSAASRARTALLATTVGPEDPFDVPEPDAGLLAAASAPESDAQEDQAQEPGKLAAGAQGGSQPAAPVDPLAFMDFDLGLDELEAEEAPAGGVAPVPAPVQKVVPVYI
ncbi:MAG TPA: hypothetical protein VF867_01175 [Arthrobacter sp.]